MEELGYNDQLEAFRIENKLEDFEYGRVIAEHKERYVVRTAQAELEAEITGHIRFTAKSRLDFPAVGDWVALKTYESDFALIQHIFPRFSAIKRKAVGHFGEVQLIAANVDFAFLVQAVDRDFNVNRLERYLTICNDARVSPVIVLSKIDLIAESRIQEIVSFVHARIVDVPVIAFSNETLKGIDQLQTLIQRGKTYCLLGSSGVGKSTLLNNLLGRSVMQTGAISQHNNKGKHVTSHRELLVMENGGILIDNPGMREVGITDTIDGLEMTFDRIMQLSQDCKFKDCTHTNEIGCCVLEAVENGDLEQGSYENYLKMLKEKSHFESTVSERREKEKAFGRFFKNYKKEMKKKREQE